MGQVRFFKLNATDGFHEQHDPTTDELTLAGLTMNGNIAMGTHEVTGLPATPSATGAASKEYVDNLISGLVWKPPVEVLKIKSDADQSGTPPTAGAAGEAWVVNNWGGGYTDGDIVEWSGSAWVVVVDEGGAGEPPDGTRVAVIDTGAAGSFAGKEDQIATYDATGDTWSFEAPSNGWAILVDGAGGYYENTGWVYDSSPGEWVQFSGAGQITAGAGLSKTGNTISVNFGDGIAETPSDYVGIDLATTPGLELTGTSPNKKLRVLTDGAHGIVLGASGVEIEIDDTPDTLDVDGDGLKVVGLPSLFKINDVAVGATVTAANLDDLTDGSNADALHTHTITAVDEAKRVEHTHLNNVTVTAGQVVRWSGTNNEVTPADNQPVATVANHRAIGVARTGGAANPGTSEVVKHGVCPGVLTSATVNTPYFLGNTGALVAFTSIPTPGRVIRMGYAANGTDLDVQIMDLGTKLV